MNKIYAFGSNKKVFFIAYLRTLGKKYEKKKIKKNN